MQGTTPVEKISGIIERVVHRNGNGFIIFNLRIGRDVFKVTGEDHDLHEADVVVCEGDWSQFNGSPQFKAKNIIPEIPNTPAGIIGYLTSGRIKGIGPALANRLVDAFGKDVLEVIEKEPARLKKVPGFGAKKIKELTDGLGEQIVQRAILIFLHNFGISKHLVKKIYKAYGFSAVDKIKENPYRLYQEISGIGFKTADKIGLQIGIAADAPHRLEAGVRYTLENSVNSTGNTGVPRATLTTDAVKLLSREVGVSSDKVEAAIDVMVKSKKAVNFKVDGKMHIFPENLFKAEQGIAKHFSRLLGPKCETKPDEDALNELIDEVQRDFGITLAENQRKAVKTSLSNPVSIITGGPGTGKTTIMRVFLECTRRILGIRNADVVACAPTGKAAKRLSISSGLDATTIHRALVYQPVEGEFTFCEENPLDASIVVCDEFSMTDTEVAYWLIQAIPTGARLIILGDDDQLKSVGPGKVLRDCIDSGRIPVTKLTDIYRQAADSKITVSAHAINNGEVPDLTNKNKNSDFWFFKTPDDIKSVKEILDLVGRMSSHYGLDPFEDIQVLTPMRKGMLGVYELNTSLQKLLNGKNLGTGIRVKQDDVDVEFCIHDKVMHIKNNRDLGVYNGDTGRVVFVDRKARILKVQYDDQTVEYAYADLEELRLSYAMTIHKSQGSEYPCVLIPATKAHYNMLFRSLFYTGITRAKRVLAIIGDPAALQLAARRVDTGTRLTGLLEHLKKQIK